MRRKIRQMTNRTIVEEESVFGQPVFGLNAKELIRDDLMNPLVVPHMDFLPEETLGKNVYKSSQSAKWLKHMLPDLRVQMVESNQKHFYIYEPTKLLSSETVIPIFFYTQQTKIFAKCFSPVFKSNQDQSKIQIGISENIDFDDENLKIIPIEQLDLTYLEIKTRNGSMLSECCSGKLNEIDEQSQWNPKITLPNPWREKADGKILRNVPINLYCDDTSGNKSKKWNKHISYYFTLSGLPPQISNQQFNCHFLCTSNIVGPLELGEMVVKQLNDMAINGFTAYDSTIGQEVHVMTSLLCFLADSPMHAEITNTPVPGNSLNSCRYCVLSSSSLKEREKIPYISKFAQKNLHGSNVWFNFFYLFSFCPNKLRTMAETKEKSKKLWTHVKETVNLDKLDKKSAEFGVRDQINRKFSRKLFKFDAKKLELLENGEELPTHMDQEIPQELVDMEEKEPKRMLNSFLELKGFDMVEDTPVEILHVFLLGAVKYLFRDFMKGLNELQKDDLLALWNSFNTNSLNIPSVRPKSMVQYASSLIGKDFRIILQAAPFIFFQFMTESKIKIWSSLCHLGSLIFQTHIEDMTEYISELRNAIDIFLRNIIEDSAQWINQAKFHMLLHLPESILRFGPACLFATEKFESYNGILRNASIHSNRQSPGQDIAITFITNIFSQNPLIQQTLGYNQSASLPNKSYPCIKKLSVPAIHQVETPQELKSLYPDFEIKQISELNLNKKQVLKKDYFILVFPEALSSSVSLAKFHHF
ncbi:uncharacterized protein PGTG_16982 [Puccinia graminis f. sp. tritici CRL 75-36-700-3]|uniref:Uncharacterized protein n=1 Tax=Puccinia graminis f. sp. tritici (strain CRL 75-36-700-3 / race SCCL) TaxID=418459 RepID=E3L453_PUCGT|nr:uncharacterized protein PGTG_16982 [Puccinia graminis f. sp. tritici CRL 75-36-700-3]EFP91328.2 hypothetical protein PGTG_16982 [Puccinia graminis f. sp. tritici CRL 75-36-700-3]